jgi:4-hydroxy-tetrahydrodipicolinate reductase
VIRLGIFGAGGRMGQLVAACVPEHPFTLTASLGRGPGDFAGCDVVIDFSVPGATTDLVSRLAGAALVTGVTGRNPSELQHIQDYAQRAPVMAAANFSLGVAVLTALVRQATRALGPAFQAEIFELHHRHKADAPSGTALRLAAAAAQGAGLPWPDARAPVRDGLRVRGDAEIGLSAARGGDVVGEHTVFLLGPAERIELTHRATDRRVFAHGALRAATWLVTQPPGLYDVDAWLHGMWA